MATEDANVQDMSVHDKDNSALPATYEGQDTDALARTIVPMPSYTDPNNPLAAAGSINMSLDSHPVTHAEDYGDFERALGDHPVLTPMDTHARDLTDETLPSPGDSQPEDRSEWKKAHWQAQAKEYGLTTSGNIETLTTRVEEHESAVEERSAFEAEANDMKREELDKLAAQYDIDPEHYSKKEDLAAAVIAAEYDEDVPKGDKAPAETQ